MNMADLLLVIAAFSTTERRSIYYKCCLTKEALHKALDVALEKGATVISIRVVSES